jgi:hypothetical protein
VPGLGLVGTMDAVGVDGAGAGRGQIAVPDFIGVFRQFDPLDLGFAIVVEQAKLDLAGVRRAPSPSQVAPSGNGLPSLMREWRRLKAARRKASLERSGRSMLPPKKAR